MSIHPGFPDLSPGRRVALPKTIDECRAWQRMVNDDLETSTRSDSSKRHLRQVIQNFENIINRINIQFPEMRTEGDYSPNQAANSREIRKSINEVINDLANVLCQTPADLRLELRRLQRELAQ